LAPDNDDKTGQIDADTAISAIVSGIIDIKWLAATNIMLLGGEGIKSVNKDGSAITPLNITILPEEATNASDVTPIVNASEIFFADLDQKNLRLIELPD
jgi:hypothetical protein